MRKLARLPSRARALAVTGCWAILAAIALIASPSYAGANCFVIISDTQNIDGVDQMIREIAALKPPFVVCVGDMPSAFGGPDLFRRLREAGIEVHNAMGNHDGGTKWAFRQHLPPYPMNSEVDCAQRFVIDNKYYYSFNRGGIHFVIVDTSADDKEAEYQWLEDDLVRHVNNPDRLPSILFMHYPDWVMGKEPGSGGPIYNVLAKHPNEHTVKYSFAGHTHKLIPYPPEETLGIPHYALYPSAPFGESEHTEYIIAHVQPDKIVFERKAVLDKGEGKDLVINPMEGKFGSLEKRKGTR